jgi:predicted flap endonuclease-1-like 5' DNA nuclease
MSAGHQPLPINDWIINMFMFLVHSAFLIALFFIIGCIIGCLLHRLLDGHNKKQIGTPSVTVEPIIVPKVILPSSIITPKVEVAPKENTEASEAVPLLIQKEATTLSKAAPPQASNSKIMTVKSKKTKSDNLTLINGIGNILEKRLNDMGVFYFEQIAQWTILQSEEFSAALGFKGRAIREGWVTQSEVLAKGGTTDHAKKVEGGRIATSRISKINEKSPKKK